MAAADSLRLNIMIKQALEVLEGVTKRDDIFAFDAEMVLEIWRGEVPGKTLND